MEVTMDNNAQTLFYSILNLLRRIQDLDNAVLNAEFNAMLSKDSAGFLSGLQLLIEGLCGGMDKLQERVSILQADNLSTQPGLTDEFRRELNIIKRLTHNSSARHGADLIDPKTGLTYEDKTSQTRAALKRKANWIFNGNKSRNKAELEASWLVKMSGGVILKSIDEKTGDLICIYVLNGPFMAKFLSKKAKIVNQKPNVINLGCDLCNKCLKYHRIESLKVYADRCRDSKDGVDCIDWDKEWSQIISVENIASQSQCSNYYSAKITTSTEKEMKRKNPIVVIEIIDEQTIRKMKKSVEAPIVASSRCSTDEFETFESRKRGKSNKSEMASSSNSSSHIASSSSSSSYTTTSRKTATSSRSKSESFKEEEEIKDDTTKNTKFYTSFSGKKRIFHTSETCRGVFLNGVAFRTIQIGNYKPCSFCSRGYKI